MAKIIAANWKMNKRRIDVPEYFAHLRAHARGDALASLIVFPPLPMLQDAIQVAKDLPICFGGQNMHWQDAGAYTGEVSAAMLQELGATHVLIGHSERRRLFHESDQDVNLKLRAALNVGLTPVVCIGESENSRSCNIVDQILEIQVGAALYGISKHEIQRIVIAYEPVWAIGSGVSPQIEDVERAHRTVRGYISKRFGRGDTEKICVLYGGSVTPENAPGILESEDVDGLLVGGSSLRVDNVSKFLGLLEMTP